jgi:hypothetical protein
MMSVMIAQLLVKKVHETAEIDEPSYRGFDKGCLITVGNRCFRISSSPD